MSDLTLENAVWKLHVRRTLAQGELPLWNPQIFTGAPFFAAGQASAAYFLSVLFYLFPLEAAYGWFTAIQLAIAGVNAYALGRTLRLRALAALVCGVVFQFSGFMVVSVVFTMVIAAAAWLPLLLAIIERVIQKREEKGSAAFRPIPYVVAGGAVVGLVCLAGHPEFLYYTLLTAGMYAAARLVAAWRRLRERAMLSSDERSSASGGAGADALRALAKTAAWLLFAVSLGLAFGAVQLLPLLELAPQNFRAGSASYLQVVGWAWPNRQILTFALPDIFGNPSHHHWFDLWALRWRPAAVNWRGEAVDTIFWGIKNYVEGGNYLGIGAWLLAAIGVAAAAARPPAAGQGGATDKLRAPTFLFLALALLSLLFAFGAPLYALPFYGLPGWDQLHSPFRWVFPYTLAMAVLGGIGMERALSARSRGVSPGPFRLGRVSQRWRTAAQTLAAIAVAGGLAALTAVAASFFYPAPFVNLAQRAVEGSDMAQTAFADGRMFWGYQSFGLARFGALAAVSGLLMSLLLRGDPKRRGDGGRGPSTAPARRANALAGAFIGVLLLDLYAAHGSFNPAVDAALSPLEQTPPVVRFINEKEGVGADPAIQYAPFRFTTFDAPGSKTFNANVGMYYGWQDIRGYDSIILKQYVELMGRIADQSEDLLYNRIAPIYAQDAPGNGVNPFAALENPLLDLMGVRYVLTEEVVSNAEAWSKIYEDGAVRVYENEEAFPRAFIAAQAVAAPAAEQPLLEADLRRVVFIEEPPADARALMPSSPQIADAAISRYTANNVFVDINLSDRGWLVLADAYAPGWSAYLRPFGGGEGDERALTIHRANSAFRAVYLPEGGQWTVRFTYSPMSFKIGLYVTFLTTMLSLFLLLWWAWGRYYRPGIMGNQARTIAKNSLVPMVLNLANRAVYFAFAMLYLRVLAPEGAGRYAWVISVYGIFEILSRYGLGTLLTREVAADKKQASRYLTNVLALRTLLWAASLILMALVVGGYWFEEAIGREELGAVAVFALVMLIANWSDAFSSLFNAFEKMEYPAGLGIAMALLQSTLGALALLLGWGIVGLAWVALAVNLVQLVWLTRLVRTALFRPAWMWDWPLQKWMAAASGPLMINHLLATIFWRIDMWLLLPLAGAASAGFYSAALKYVDGLNIIPSTFTLAVFPLMSRFARQEGASLARSYRLSVRLLLLISLPIALTVALLAHPLISLLGGASFANAAHTAAAAAAPACRLAADLFGWEDCAALGMRGGSALALQVIIWSIPIGFVNSVTQYALIAADQQRYLTKAFIAGVAVNLLGNLLLIPSFGYIGAAVVTILSEICLLILFGRRVREQIGAIDWGDLIWRPALAAAAMGALALGLTSIGTSVWLTILPVWAVYAAVIALLGGFADRDLRVASSALLQGRFGWQTKDAPEQG